MNTEQSQFITEAALREAVGSGHKLEIICLKNAFQKGPTWYGVWVVQVTDSLGRVRHLVTSRGSIREFKTINGLVSFLVSLGFERVDVPLKV